MFGALEKLFLILMPKNIYEAFQVISPEVSDFHKIKVMGRVHIRISPAKAVMLIPLLL